MHACPKFALGGKSVTARRVLGWVSSLILIVLAFLAPVASAAAQNNRRSFVVDRVNPSLYTIDLCR
jgi:hypothetical protein